MRYRLRTLLAVTEAEMNVGIALIALAIISVGVFSILTPPRHLLQSDHRTARWFFNQELKASGDKDRAIAAAGLFYRLFGVVLIAFGLAVLAIAFIPSSK